MGNVRVVAGITGAAMGLLVALTLFAGPGADLAVAAQIPVPIVGTPVRAAQSGVVNMAELARQDAAHPAPNHPGVRVVPKPPAPPVPGASSPPFLPQLLPPEAGLSPQAPSPSPAQDFAGLDDIANLSTGLRILPPDTDGAVGLTKVMSGLNNNYRIFTKATGAVVSTVGTGTFWSGLGGSDFFDPKTLYDPVNDRWLVVMMSNHASADSSIEIGVSQTSDPSGSYYRFRFDADATNVNWADFPTIGFDKDYVAVNMNMFPNAGGDHSVYSKMLVLDYPLLRAGTSRAWFFTGSTLPPDPGPVSNSSPAATYSATESTLYVSELWDYSPGTYRVDTITGNSATGPVYTSGAVKSRGLSWAQASGNILPQKAPAGGGTPLKIDTQDSFIRSTPVVRDGFIYYTQTVGLPAGGLTRTSILWTKLTASTGDVADGGLVDDPTATATNGGKWYAYPHIAVNKYGDIIVGFSQFSSTQYASAGYAVHAASDPAGTMRDPAVYKAGQDAYQRIGTGTRNRWGDYSKAQVDPSNDADLWVLNEYAKPATGPSADPGVWGTWWGKVAAPSASPGPAPGADDDIPGVVIPSSPFTGSVSRDTDLDDVFRIALTAGQTLKASITGPSGSNFDMYLYPPGTATVNVAGGTVAAAQGVSYPDAFTYLATQSGTYYLDVYALAGAGDYTVTYSVSSTSPPIITSFAPSWGPVGTAVSLTGTGFTGANKVAFNGTAASFTVVSATHITATVPADATTGPIAVTTPAGTDYYGKYVFEVWLKTKVTLKLSGLTSGAMRLGRRVTAKGKVTPAQLWDFFSGFKVKLTVGKKKGAKWVNVKSVWKGTKWVNPTGGGASYLSYRWKYKPVRKGAYRMRATIARTDANMGARTKWRTFKVK
jgi:IPT/TIG domain